MCLLDPQHIYIIYEIDFLWLYLMPHARCVSTHLSRTARLRPFSEVLGEAQKLFNFKKFSQFLNALFNIMIIFYVLGFKFM